MQVAILAGGRGSRLAEESRQLPKPMVRIGDRPLLGHIIDHYVRYGYRDFLIAAGYLGNVIQEYADSGGFRRNQCGGVSGDVPVEVRVENTGLETNTGGRVGRLAPIIGQRRFLLTWGDGLSDVDLRSLVEFHVAHGRWATVTAVHPPPRFGRLTLVGDRVAGFDEKPPDDGGWINGAFFVLEPDVFDLIDDDETSWERDVMVRLAAADQLRAYRHRGFWQCMDTIAERDLLRRLWKSGNPPWLKEDRRCA